MKVCKHCVISGQVQGVFFRRETSEMATSLGLHGWVRNLENGDVECLVCGDEKRVEQLCQWLHKGPPAAQVSAVQIKDAPLEDFDRFTIIR